MRVLLALTLLSTVGAQTYTSHSGLFGALVSCIGACSDTGSLTRDGLTFSYCKSDSGGWGTGDGSSCAGITNWDVSAVTRFDFLFKNAAAFNQDLSGWDVSEATNIQAMFGSAAAFNGDISTWDVSKVTTTTWLFQSASAFNQDLSTWDVGNVLNTAFMFNGASVFNQDLSAWDVSQATDIGGMFEEASAFNQDLSAWDVGEVTNIASMFKLASAFNGDLSAWDVSKVTNMIRVFEEASVFNQDLSAWDVSKVGTMALMFQSASAFNQDLSAWDVGKVNNMYGMFQSASAFNQVLCGQAWVDITGTQTTQTDMFTSSSGSIAASACVCPYNLCLDDTHSTGGVCNAGTCTCPAPFGGDRCGDCQPGTQRVGATCVACPDGEMSSYDSTCGASCTGSLVPVGKKCVFQLANIAVLQTAVDACITEDATGACPSYEPIGLWDVSQVTDMSQMFKDKTQFNQNLNGWDVSQVTNMYQMFLSASAFNQDLSLWDVSQVTNMAGIFMMASSFNQDLSAWDVSQVTNMGGVFHTASAFNQDLSAWDVGKVTNMYNMFYYASAFNQDISAWDVGNVTSMYAVFNRATAFNQDLSAWNVGKVNEMYAMFYSASAFNQVLCGAAWVDSDASQILMFSTTGGGSIAGSIAGSACDCPYNLCREETHPTGGSCSAGTCTCTAPLGGDRCERVVCPSGEQKVGEACVECPTDQMSAYDSTCGASCPTGYSQHAQNDKKCVFTPADRAALFAKLQECVGVCSQALSTGTYNSVAYQYCYSNTGDWGTGDGSQCADIELWDVSQVTNMAYLFAKAAAFNANISAWDMSNVINSQHMLIGNSAFNQDLSGWDVSEVLDMSAMFGSATLFNSDIRGWDVSKVATFHGMFNNAVAFNYDLSSWDVSSASSLNFMFDGAKYPYHLCGQAWGESTATQNTLGADIGCFCPPGEEEVNYVCVACGDGKMSAYNSACETSCAASTQTPPISTSFTQVGKKCVFRPPGQFELVDELLSCLGACGTVRTYDGTQYCNTATVGDWHNADGSNCVGIEYWDTSQVTDFSYIFHHANNFNQDISRWDTSSATKMVGTFKDTQSFSGNLSAWNVSKVTVMEYTFKNSAFNGDISNWDTSQVILMSATFSRSLFNGDVSEWDVSSVTNFNFLFGAHPSWLQSGYEDKFNGDISKWDVSRATTLGMMFSHNPNFDRDISDWDMSGVTSVYMMFSNGKFNQDISGWDMRGITQTFGMFKDNTAFNQDLSAWEFASGMNDHHYNGIFDGITSMTQELDGAYWVGRGVGADWYSGVTVASSANTCPYNLCRNDTHNTGGTCLDGVCTCPAPLGGSRCERVVCPPGEQAVGMACVECPTEQMSAYDSTCGASCGSLTQVGKKCVFQPADRAALFTELQSCIGTCSDIRSKTESGLTFNYCHSTNSAWSSESGSSCVDIANWDVSAVTRFDYLFHSASAFNQDISKWNVSRATNIQMMFQYANAFNQDLSAWDVSQVTDMLAMFHEASVFNGDLSAWNVGQVTNMYQMFRWASTFNQDLSAWDVSRVTTMREMFYKASAFNQSLSAWDVGKVTSMAFMFYQAPAFNGDLSTWKVGQVTDMQQMFYYASAFNQDVSKWDVNHQVTSMSYMFANTAVFNQDISAWDVSKVFNLRRMFYYAFAFNQDLSAWDVDKVTDMRDMFKNAAAFNHVLCGDAWVDSTATQTDMFSNAGGGSIAASKGKCPRVPGHATVNITFDGGRYRVCPGDQARVTWNGYHNIAEVNDATDCTAGTEREGYHNANFELLFSNDELSADATERFFKCDSHCGSRFSTYCDAGPGYPHNMCRNITHGTGGAFVDGACVCPAPLGGDRCQYLFCPPGEQAVGQACVACPDGQMSSYDSTCGASCGSLTRVGKQCVFQPANKTVLQTAVDACLAEDATGECPSYEPIRVWDVSRVTDMRSLFAGAASFNQDLSAWDVSGVTNMQFMFSGASVFDGDLSAWDVSSVTDMQWMFSSASAFNQDVSTWNVAKVTEMYAMFNMATSFNQDVSTWDVGEVVSMNQMFWDATSFDQDISAWNVGKVTNLNNMFTNTQFQYDLSAWDVGNVNFMNEMFHGTNYSFTLCGDAWVNSAASQTDFGTNITGPCPDSCPYNLCRNITHATGGVCAAGVCTCPIPVEGRRCDAACSGNRYNFADGCDTCIPGFAKSGGACRNASVSETQFLSGFKAGKTKSARAKAVRAALRPMRDAKKTLKENTVSVPMVTADLSDAQLVLIQEIEAKIGGTVELKMAIAAEQTAPLENPSAAQCTYDVNDQEAGKKTVFHAYGVDNYMYLCDTITGSTVFVAEVKEGVNGSAVRCRGESGWDAEVIKAPGETHTCNGTPFLIGSVTLECGPDEGCCSSAECGHGTCANLACVCDAGWEGATCNSPTACADITESELYQKKGCCDC